MLLPRAEQQLWYCLLTLTCRDQRQPVGYGIVVDTSRSMRIPILSDDQFRELVRAGGVQEALVDGVPVWELSEPLLPEQRAQVRSCLDWVAEGIGAAITLLAPHDRITLVGCSERAEAFVASRAAGERREIDEGLERLRRAQLGDGTDLVRGLELALDELAGVRLRGQRHLILITDGFVGREAECSALGRRAAKSGIAISTVGLGAELRGELLVDLADLCGGRADSVEQMEDIPQTIAAQVRSAQQISMAGVSLSLSTAPGVSLRRTTRVSPTIGPIHVTAERRAGEQRLLLGDIGATRPTQLLLEFAITRPAEDCTRIARVTLSQGRRALAECELPAHYVAAPPALPPRILAAAARANAMRLWRRASDALEAGRKDEAASLLEALERRLGELGEHGLAALAHGEANRVRHTGLSDSGVERKLLYALRHLEDRPPGGIKVGFH